MCAALLEERDGTVPSTRKGLLSLPGVGRTYADIVLHFYSGEQKVEVARVPTCDDCPPVDPCQAAGTARVMKT